MSVISPMTLVDVQGHFGLFCIFMILCFNVCVAGILCM